MAPGLIEPILAFFFGLIIGSFLNVCIHRWPRGRSVVRPRSHCVRCRKIIPWYDNIPLFSYLALGGKCRFCGRRISLRYPVVELLTGLVFFFFVRTLGPTLVAVKMCVFGAILVALIFTDIEKRLLPDELTLGGAVVGVLFAFFVPVPDFTAKAFLWFVGIEIHGRAQWIAEAALGSLLPAFFLWLAGWIYERLRHKEGLGLGDVKLIVMMGAFLGWKAIPFIIFASSLAGSIVGVSMMLIQKKDSKLAIPFGPYLAFGAVLYIFYGGRLIQWYLHVGGFAR